MYDQDICLGIALEVSMVTLNKLTVINLFLKLRKIENLQMKMCISYFFKNTLLVAPQKPRQLCYVVKFRLM